MRTTKLQELEKLAAKLSATARTLPPGEDRQNAYREIARFRDRIAALKSLAEEPHNAAPVLPRPHRSSRISPQRQHQA
jgi:ribosomal protein S11